MNTPKNNNVNPPIERTNAVISCVFGFMIFEILCKDIPAKGTFANVLEVECYVQSDFVLHRRF